MEKCRLHVIVTQDDRILFHFESIYPGSHICLQLQLKTWHCIGKHRLQLDIKPIRRSLIAEYWNHRISVPLNQIYTDYTDLAKYGLWSLDFGLWSSVFGYFQPLIDFKGQRPKSMFSSV